MPAVAVLHRPNADVFAWRWTGSIQWIAQSPVRRITSCRMGKPPDTSTMPEPTWVPMSAALELSAKKATIAGIVRHQHCLAMSGHKRVKHAKDESRSDQHWQRCKASRMQNLERLHRPE
jgi:hypothetical protein